MNPNDAMKIILKNHLKQKQVSKFHQAFECLQFHHLKTYKIKHDVYRGENCMKKFFECLKKPRKDDNLF